MHSDGLAAITRGSALLLPSYRSDTITGMDETAAPGTGDTPGCDELDPAEQGRRRAEWADAIRDRIRDLDLATEFASEGRSWVEADDTGAVVHHAPRDSG